MSIKEIIPSILYDRWNAEKVTGILKLFWFFILLKISRTKHMFFALNLFWHRGVCLSWYKKIPDKLSGNKAYKEQNESFTK